MKNNICESHKSLFYLFLIISLSACGGGSDSIPSSNYNTEPYEIIDLGAGYAGDINEKGHVTGVSDGQAYIYNGQSKTLIGTIGNEIVSPVGININDEVVAIYRPTISSSDTSVAYYSGTAWTLLGKFGSEFAWPNDINDSGQIAGSYKPSGSAVRAFIYTSGTITVIPVPGKVVGESAYNDTVEINNAGMVSGRFKDTSNIDKAYIFDGSTVHELGTIADPLPGRYSYGTGLNNAGHSVDVSQNSSYRRRAFLYKESTMMDLGTLEGNSHASDINNTDMVVGDYIDINSDTRAFIHNGTEMQDLTSLLNNNEWILEKARNINDAGMIIGTGLINNEVHGYLLIPQ